MSNLAYGFYPLRNGYTSTISDLLVPKSIFPSGLSQTDVIAGPGG